MEEFKSSSDQLISILVNYAPKIVSALAILLIGFWVIKLIVRKLKMIMTKPFITVAELAVSTVNILMRAEVKQSDYFDVLYQGFERVKVRFDEEGIHFPFPKQDVHIIETNTLS